MNQHRVFADLAEFIVGLSPGDAEILKRLPVLRKLLH